MDTLLLIDGNAIMHRAYYALPPLQTSSGVQTNILYGFLAMLVKAVEDFSPTHIMVCFDTPAPTFRKELYPQYQAHRPKVDDGFKIQVPLLKSMLAVSAIPMLEKPGFEADDIIGTIVSKYKETMRILVLTGDKDIMQLVDKNVSVVTPKVGMSSVMLYGVEEVKQKLGVSPSVIPELKALMGDPSDNYPGAKGIGPKTAVKLLNHFKTAENVLKRVDSIENERVRALIKEHADSIRLSKKLATISCDVPIAYDIKQAEFHGFPEKLKTFLAEHEINSLRNRIFSQKKEEIVKERKQKEESSVDQGKLF